MRNSPDSIDAFQSLQHRQSRLVVPAVILSPLAVVGLFGVVAAVGHVIIAISAGHLVHGSVEALFAGAIGSVPVAVEVVLIRKIFKVRSLLKELLPQN